MIPIHLPILLRGLRLTFSPRHFRLRRALYVVVIGALFTIFLVFVQLARLVDDLCFRAYRRQTVTAPIYVMANPRSGTTFFHRLLTHDPQFTWFRLWQTILPTVGLYRLINGLAWLDGRAGGVGARLVKALNGVAFGGWDGIHSAGFDRSEEDEMLWMYTLLSPAVFMLFPWVDEFREAHYMDRLVDARKRRRLSRYYHGCLQRHLYGSAEGRTLLAKNVLNTGRIETMLEAVPDMRIVHLVRHPYEAVPSFLSMFTAPWQAHSPELVADPDAVGAMARVAIEYYKRMAELERELPDGQVITLTYEELMADPFACVERVYHHFGLELTPVFRRRLIAELDRQRRYVSRHEYSLEGFGLTREWLYGELRELFDRFNFDPGVDVENAAAARGGSSHAGRHSEGV